MVIIRTTNAGVFYGNLAEWDPTTRTARLTTARRIWYWSGAASLSELAMRGPSKPAQCKVPTPVDSIMLSEVIEILETTQTARQAIEAVPEWTLH